MPRPGEDSFCERAHPGRQFLTRGRESPAHVAEFALCGFERGRPPSVIPGLGYRLKACGYRFMPRPLVVPGSCAAVGFYTDGSGHQQGFVVSRSNGRWR